MNSVDGDEPEEGQMDGGKDQVELFLADDDTTFKLNSVLLCQTNSHKVTYVRM